MKKEQTKKSKKQCPAGNFFEKIMAIPFLRMVLFVAVIGIIFFLIGSVIWQAKQFADSGVMAEQNEHDSRIKSKLLEMKTEMNFFEKISEDIGNGKIMNIEEKREVNSHIMSLSGQIADLDRYYLDWRFDSSLNFFNRTKGRSDDFETIKKLTRDGELFLDNIIYINLSSGASTDTLDLAQYNFKIFKEKYQEAALAFSL